MDKIKENEIYDKFQDFCNSYKGIILSDDKHLCNTECPLRDTNRCENVFFYQQGKLDGAKEFVEWLLHQDKVMYDPVSKDFYTCDDEHCIISTLSIDEALAEWQKEQKNAKDI